MELITANLHTDRVKCRSDYQITLEEDKNISERNPDALNLLLEKGRVVLDEVRPGKDVVAVKGKLVYEVLYTSDEEGRLFRVQGDIPFEEKIRSEGMEAADVPELRAEIEDLRSALINSRKINVRALVNLRVLAKELYDEEIITGLRDADGVEVKKELLTQSAKVVEQKDVFRIKEDLELPASYPEIQTVLWKFVELTKWEVRPLEGSLGIQGELRIFILYESGGELPQIKAYETTIPFSGNVECPGSGSYMVADVSPVISTKELNVKADYDGEERVIDVEVVLELPIQMYEKKEVEMVTDAYAASMEITPVFTPGSCREYCDRMQARVKAAQEIHSPSSARILQICFVNPIATVEDTRMTAEGLQIQGVVAVTVLYLTEEEAKPYETVKEEIPFTYLAEHVEEKGNISWKVTPMVEQAAGILLDESKMEIKLTLCLDILLCKEWQQPYLRELKAEPMEPEKMNNLPGIVVYMPSQREALWDVGKRYHTSVDSIRTLNGLSTDTAEPGQKILLVKEAR